MIKAKKLIEEILKKFSSKLVWRVVRDRKESISIDCSGGCLRVEANNERNLCFALEQALTAWQSGHMGEYLGRREPAFPLRPLWVFDAPTEAFCKSLCRMGYNAVILAGEVDPSLFQSYGLKVFIKPEIKNFCPLNLSFKPGNDRVDGIFWESGVSNPEFLGDPGAFDLTLFDLVNKEMTLIEKSIGNLELIYYMPLCEEVYWLSDLMDNAGPRTTIAFSAVAGDPREDHLPRHPFWDTLRALPDISSTPLLPIINTGAVKQGECLWPAPPLDLLEQFLPRLTRHNFAGFVGMTTRVPESYGLLHLSLWAAAQALWHGKTPELSVETWLKAHRPDLNFSSVDFIAMRGIVKGAGQAQTKERQGALLSALLLLDLKHKQSAYFTHFASDMRNLLQSPDGKDSFWTKMEMGKVVRLERAQSKTHLMNKIILENT